MYPDETFDSGEAIVADSLFNLVYEDLRLIAARIRRGERQLTINPTALVHEAWLRLKDSPALASMSVPHFKNAAGKVMRRILVDQARRKYAHKRAGEIPIVFVPLESSNEPATVATGNQLLALDEALHRLANNSPRQAKIVECLFFGGLTTKETAELIAVSESTVEKEWRRARAWLVSQLGPQL